jgi:hypothetical protein
MVRGWSCFVSEIATGSSPYDNLRYLKGALEPGKAIVDQLPNKAFEIAILHKAHSLIDHARAKLRTIRTERWVSRPPEMIERRSLDDDFYVSSIPALKPANKSPSTTRASASVGIGFCINIAGL